MTEHPPEYDSSRESSRRSGAPSPERPWRIVLVGAGGLGVPAAWGICEGWDGTRPIELHIVDGDVIALDNLHRQVLFEEHQIGCSKAETLVKTLERMVAPAARLTFVPHRKMLTEANIRELLRDADLVLDGTDSVSIKLLINDYCVAHRIPFCYAGSVGTGGQLLSVGSPGVGACLRCLFGAVDAADAACIGETCRESGILGPAVGAIGFALGGEALRLTAHSAPVSSPASQDGCVSAESGSRWLRYELRTARWHEARYGGGGCELGCGSPRQILDLTGHRCPATFLYTKLAAERLAAGASIDQSHTAAREHAETSHSTRPAAPPTLDVRFATHESATNVWRSIQEEGYPVLSPPRMLGADLWQLIIRAAKDADVPRQAIVLGAHGRGSHV